MKTFALSMLAASAVALPSMEFMRGCQKGAFLMNDDQLYEECPAVIITQQAQSMTGMAKPAIMMAMNMAQSQGTTIPGMEYLDQAVDEIAFFVSLYMGYEGGEFCQGEIFAHEVAKFVLSTGRKEAAKFFPILDPEFHN